MNTQIDDPELGRVTCYDSEWEFEIQLEFEDELVGGRINTEDHTPSADDLRTVRRTVAWLRSHEPDVRKYISDHMLKPANDDWLDEGSTPISEAAFTSMIELVSVSFNKHMTASLCYDDGDVFGGHAIFVDILPDGRFSCKPFLFG